MLSFHLNCRDDDAGTARWNVSRRRVFQTWRLSKRRACLQSDFAWNARRAPFVRLAGAKASRCRLQNERVRR